MTAMLPLHVDADLDADRRDEARQAHVDHHRCDVCGRFGGDVVDQECGGCYDRADRVAERRWDQ